MLAEQLIGQSTTHLTEVGKGILIHSQIVCEFLALQKSAQQAGFNLQIASGFRSFERQSAIWNNKYAGKTPILGIDEKPLNVSKLSELEKLYAILHWSALPGASRHHWGTDLDIFDPSLLPEKQSLQLKVSEYNSGGYFQELNLWLTENIASFGFYRPYQTYQGGVAVEPWHISFAPIAEKALKQLEPDLIYELISQNKVLGKSLICQQLPIIYEQFVTNINQLDYKE